MIRNDDSLLPANPSNLGLAGLSRKSRARRRADLLGRAFAVQPVSYAANLGTANTDRNRSPNIWKDCPWNAIAEGQIPGMVFYDDFQDYPLIGTQTTQIAQGKYKVFATTGSSVTNVSTINSVEVAGAALDLSTDTDNDSASLAQSYPHYLLSGLTTTSGKLWFECCIAVNTLLTNTHGFFVGLAETDQWTLATGVPFNGASATITNSASAIGFFKDEDGLGVVQTVLSDRATSWTAIDAAASTLTATYTFLKLGFTYDPLRTGTVTTTPKDCCIQFYANNLMLATGYTSAALIANTNLDANALGLLVSQIADSAGTTSHTYLKWWKCAQMLPN